MKSEFEDLMFRQDIPFGKLPLPGYLKATSTDGSEPARAFSVPSIGNQTKQIQSDVGDFTFVDLFAGIGGLNPALTAGGRCCLLPG